MSQLSSIQPLSKDVCSPTTKQYQDCMNYETLQELCRKYNTIRKKIPSLPAISPTLPEEQLRSKLFATIQQESKCNQAICLIDWVLQQENKLKHGTKETPVTKERMNPMHDQTPLDSIFKPTKPRIWTSSSKEIWLSTLDINWIMKQYCKLYKQAMYLGAVPINYDEKEFGDTCVSPEICELNIMKSYEDGYRQFLVVFNSQDSSQPGGHWTCLFASYLTGGIYYIDSTGRPPNEQIMKLMRTFQSVGNQLLQTQTIPHDILCDDHILTLTLQQSAQQSDTSLHISNHPFLSVGSFIYIAHHDSPYTITRIEEQTNTSSVLIQISPPLTHSFSQGTIIQQIGFHCFYNQMAHQSGMSECGVYCLYFLLMLLGGNSFYSLMKRKITDNNIASYRDFFFKSRDYHYEPDSILPIDLIEQL